MEATSPLPCFSQRYLRNQETEIRKRLTQNYLESLHSTRKQPTKPWKKPPSMAPTHPRIYRVEPVDFKELVQKLTGPPSVLSPPAREAAAVEALAAGAGKESGFMGSDLSPSSSRFWDAFPLLSPSNLSRW
ncbi:PREDICTED: VQ motif-containing protein 29-like [Tarenaya hassleriana]|uniref:VQ motif-containing protein 29-like n=1 Tax=Tarenaya hassleriana TaxID=28532 RepID=UPI00053C8DB7|nr:PREDICTED: VQ motif-containing protein 29-like [Tarenaya hassleriana]